MFKFRLTLLTLSALFFSLLIISCDDDDSTNPTNNCTKVTAKVTDSLTLDFAACTVIFTKVPTDSFTQRNISAIMQSGSKTYTLVLSINDKGSGAGTYNVANFEGQISLSDGTPENTFNYFPEGEITLTTVTDNSWVGSFHADIKNATNAKTIKINNGKINIK